MGLRGFMFGIGASAAQVGLPGAVIRSAAPGLTVTPGAF